VASLIECVPNFSEGRRPEVIAAIVSAIDRTDGVHVLDHTSDPSHNRSVVTFAGARDAVTPAAEASVQAAVELIDMQGQSGGHPRIGAVDVMPFVPLGATAMSDVVDLARAFAERTASSLGLPVYLYGDAALRPDRRRLADIRRGQYEMLRELIVTDPRRAPDFGPARLHPTAGAMAVGARRPLIAFNINLRTDDLRIAERIARTIRESSGGMPAVQAMGVMVEVPGGGLRAQVSTNLVDWERTGLPEVVAAVRRLAREAGTQIHGCELIGLAPAAALDRFASDPLARDLGNDGALEPQLARFFSDAGGAGAHR